MVVCTEKRRGRKARTERVKVLCGSGVLLVGITSAMATLSGESRSALNERQKLRRNEAAAVELPFAVRARHCDAGPSGLLVTLLIGALG